MIEIRISDPFNTPPAQLRAVTEFLTEIARHGTAATLHGSAPSASAVRTIDPADNPAAGVSPSEVFGGHGSPELDADAAKLNALYGAGAAGPTAAQVFGGNAPAAPAPSIAGAALSSTAPAATLAISTNPTASVPVAPPPGNVAPTVAAPVPHTPTSAPGVELDKNGLPWDGRIHSETKSKNKDQSWRNRRGIDPAVVTAVEAELRAAMGAPGNAAGSPVVPAPPSTTVQQPAAAVAPPPPAAHGAVTSTPAAPSAAPSVPNVPAPPANGAPAASTAIPTAPATSPETGSSVEVVPAPSMTFPMLAPKITAGLGAGTLTQAQVTQALATVGLPSLPMLINRPDLVPTVAALLGLA